MLTDSNEKSGAIPQKKLFAFQKSAKRVLLVRQAMGLKLWTLPGGKVKLGEALVKALNREIQLGQITSKNCQPSLGFARSGCDRTMLPGNARLLEGRSQ